MDWTRRKTNKIFSEFGVSKLFEQNYQKSRTGGKETIYNQSSILNYVKEYYEILYTSINSDITYIDL